MVNKYPPTFNLVGGLFLFSRNESVVLFHLFFTDAKFMIALLACH